MEISEVYNSIHNYLFGNIKYDTNDSETNTIRKVYGFDEILKITSWNVTDINVYKNLKKYSTYNVDIKLKRVSSADVLENIFLYLVKNLGKKILHNSKLYVLNGWIIKVLDNTNIMISSTVTVY